MNDTFGNDARVQKEMGSAEVLIHPEDATSFGLKEGSEAILSNETGELVLEVKLSEEVRPGTVLSYKGRWPKRENELANVNTLNPGKKTDMGESTAVHSVEVTVTPLRTD